MLNAMKFKWSKNGCLPPIRSDVTEPLAGRKQMEGSRVDREESFSEIENIWISPTYQE